MNPNLLLVDDDEDDRMFFQEAIKEIDRGIHFVSLKNGHEALNYLEACASLPDAIFLDINMPIVDGYKCLKQLRSNTNYDGIVVFMYSTSYIPETAIKLQNAGADFYIRKPISFNELKQLIEKALNLLPQVALENKNDNNFFITNEK
ncbi:response regulator [Winogradskyella schleiferi]|uniref:response regulator n=1 Tax=Winogradskyella schleiferi TaxID=2686078 RepID=UPI0015BE78AD|nr:response regulator [Winogradskyella schleiferi]